MSIFGVSYDNKGNYHADLVEYLAMHVADVQGSEGVSEQGYCWLLFSAFPLEK